MTKEVYVGRPTTGNADSLRHRKYVAPVQHWRGQNGRACATTRCGYTASRAERTQSPPLPTVFAA